MELPVYVYGMSVLRRVADEIPGDFAELDQFIADLFETMHASDGVGLAAPQVGKSLRIFVVDAAPMSEDRDDPGLKEFRKVFINPIIIEQTGQNETMEEGCLSIPKIREEVSRPFRIRIEYFDENWKLHDEEYEGIRARIIQHEYDHLEGKLFVDRISPIRRKLLTSRLNSISKGNVDCDYRIIYPKKKGVTS